MPRIYNKRKVEAPKPSQPRLTRDAALAKIKARGIPVDRWLDISNRSFNGNIIKSQHLRRLLEESYQDLTFALWNSRDLPSKLADAGGAWEPFTASVWACKEEFNALVAQRHGISEKDGLLWFGNKAICYRPKDFDERLKREADAKQKERFRALHTENIDHVSINAHQRVEADLEIKTERLSDGPPSDKLDMHTGVD